MLEDAFSEVYLKFKLNLYRGIFQRLKDRESSLSASEAYVVEVIYALDEPTIGQFARFLSISQPNATYKVNSLIRKGYIEKVPSDTDKREFHLRTTPKFHEYYSINQNYLKTVMRRIRARFSEEETSQLEHMLRVISDELMPENQSSLLKERDL